MLDSITCSSCKYWIYHNNIKGTCDKIDIDTAPSTLNEKEGAAMAVNVDDDSGMSVSLLTFKSFGCLRHSSLA
jgi:hypothetical protein